MQIIEKAHAKINLILMVTGKRQDGYHALQTIFQSLALHDTLGFSKVTNGEISVSTNHASLTTGVDNLVWRAATKLKQHYGVTQGVRIELEKRIPIAAGLGGGSSDAAATLRGLIRLWQLPWEPQPLAEIAAQLGSDVPFCLAGGTALGTGRGEKLVALAPCPHFHVVLANPGFPVATAEVYGAVRTAEMAQSHDIEGMIYAIEKQDPQRVASRLANTLEMATFRLYPAVRALKEEMSKAGAAIMSGSGPTVFALFTTAQAAMSLVVALRHRGIPVWLTETQKDDYTGGAARV